MKAKKLVSMPALTLVIVAGTIAGCASTGGWRALSIDGSSEQGFDASVSRLMGELPQARREIFELALEDVMRTESQNGELRAASYTDEDFRSQLDGMTYESVIALADQTGPPIRRVYYSRRTHGDPWAGRPWPGTDPDRFPAAVQPPPGLLSSQ